MSQYRVSCRYHGVLSVVTLSVGLLAAPVGRAALLDISPVPMFLGGASTPLVMMVMGRDHKLYYEAYNDASDLNGDGVLDTTYKPDKIEYFGLFNSYLCYGYGSGKFTPASKTITKKCSGNWSGDFLNYLTTSRMDALRKVFYGGYRIPASDTASGTVLERAYIPQDAHSWGKEYHSIAHDGYDISEYAPLALPSGTRHLFANTTLLADSTRTPLLRVLPNSTKRIWDWVSKEQPVAGSSCTGGSCESDGSTNNTRPADHAAFVQLLAQFATSGHLLGTSAEPTPSTPDFTLNGRIECSSSCNPYGTDDYYITVFKGTLNIVTEGDYQFSLKGDDATEVLIDNELVFIRPSYNFCTAKESGCIGTKYLSAGTHTIEYHHEEGSGGDSYYLYWKGKDSKDKEWEVVPKTKFSDLVISTYNRTTPASKIADYTVRVDACVAGLRDENNPDASEYCRGYPAEAPTIYKPAGLLQQYGEDEPERMAFGLLSGSYKKNTSGGVLRKNIGPFSKTDDSDNEVVRATGIFNTSVKGIVNTLDNLKVVGFGDSVGYGGSYSYGTVDGKGCGWITDRPIAEGECRMWGNPIAEMMYESLRYFAGQPSTSAPKATPAYDYSGTTDATVPLPKADWKYPFRNEAGGYSGAKCFMLTVSDINPSFDTDQIPGSAFTGSVDSTLPGLDVATEAAAIWSNEEKTNPAFIGHSLDNTPAYDGAPTPKTVTSLGRIRGLSPEEPTKQGGYYSASVAFFGNAKGIGSTPGKQRVETMSVVLASPLPRIEIPVGTGTDKRYVTLVPFAKSVGGGYGIDPAQGKFQPTNQIVDFYVDSINYADPNNGGRPHGVFQINYEDVEQGADHDMDAIVVYEFWVLADGNVKVKLDSTYAAGGIIQHMGYVIAGTDGQDGIYLDVRDKDTTSGDPDYYLDTPVETTTDTGVDGGMTKKRSEWASTAYQSSGMLPLTSIRLFRPSSSMTATASFIKHDPLWYAAKWGGFNDTNKNGLPDQLEWDSDKDGVPDNYFLVTNAGKLKEQLSKAFQSILSKRGSASVLAVESGQGYGAGLLYQARFNSANWTGQVLAIKPTTNATGKLIAETKWDAGEVLDKASPDGRKILTKPPVGDEAIKLFEWASLDDAQKQMLSPKKADGTYDLGVGGKRLAFLRGDNSNEGDAVGQFRKRDTELSNSSDLGDIVNSSPVYVSYPPFPYRDSLETPTHASFRAAQAGRSPMIYVGSNDGMLHGFDAVTGSEEVAYVPSLVWPELARLTSQNYNTRTGADQDPQTSQHIYYVDSTPISGDAFFKEGNDWRTVLIGRLGAGGQGTFALDITDPTSFSASTTFLWEFTDANDADLGYTFGRSLVKKLNNGQWAAIFGNGYNSAAPDGHVGSGRGVLFVVNVETGDLIKKIDAGSSSSGLSTPTFYDVDGDNKVDWIYAGDVAGNLWKFDVRSSSESAWTAKLLFAAGSGQSITSSPVTLENPNGGVLVLFGTGRYLGNTDTVVDPNNPPKTQSYYAIWDRESAGADGDWETTEDNVPFSPVTGVSDLLQQTFDDYVLGPDGKTYRTSSANEICWLDEENPDKFCEFVCLKEAGCKNPDGSTAEKGESYKIPPKYLGWYINLPYLGERVYTDSEINDARVIFVSNAPAEAEDPNATPSPCDVKVSTGKHWLNMLDAVSGKRLSESFKKPEAIKVLDPDTNELVSPSSQEGPGLSPGQTIVPSEPSSGEPSSYKVVVCGTDGECEVLEVSQARVSWRQL